MRFKSVFCILKPSPKGDLSSPRGRGKGASPSPGLDGGAPRSESKINDCRGQSHIDFIVGSTPLHCSVYGVVPFTRTGYYCHVAGGRLPMELWCDCPRQSIDFDSLREAPPLRQRTTFFIFFARKPSIRFVEYTVSVTNTIIVNCPLSIVNFGITVNCPLSTVN